MIGQEALPHIIIREQRCVAEHVAYRMRASLQVVSPLKNKKQLITALQKAFGDYSSIRRLDDSVAVERKTLCAAPRKLVHTL